MTTTVAYLRKSRSDDPSKEVSEDVQRQSIEAMAARDGVSVTTWYKDWDRSADESKAKRRTEYVAMLRAIERCDVDVVYAYAVDRLYRSLPGFLRLREAAKRCGTRIVTHRDGEIGADGSPMGKAFDGIRAIFTELELDTAKVRAQAAYQARVARGDHVGQVPYGYRLVKVDGVNRLEPDPARPVAPILDAYRRAGGRVRTAVRILNDEMHLPAPYGGVWDRPSLLRLITREAPGLLPRRTATGRREAPATPAKLAKLLRCHCGALLTPNRHVERRRSRETVAVSYYCARGNAGRQDHPRVYVAESKLLPIIAAEAARLRLPGDRLAGEDAAERLATITERKRRLALTFADGALDEPTYRERLADLGRDVDAIEATTRAVEIPAALDWEWPVASLNAALRAVFTRIDLGPDLLPVAFTWAAPHWRAA
jgi:DNA invertase Pin-like site-specific DNA recombinase